MEYYPSFKKSPLFTIGVEVELQILDPKTMNLSPAGPEILKSISQDYKDRIKPEFIKSMLEVTTRACNSLYEVRKDLKEGIKHLEKRAHELGYILFSSSLHPFSRCKDQRLSDDERYHRLMDEFQIVGRRLITQGLHCHIGIDDPDRAIEVVDKIRTYLPLLLGLTASSPFFEGEDTGLCSFRSKLFDALPRSGIPDPLVDWENFQVLANLLFQAGIIKSSRDIWWDVRPHPLFGTVEIRICDVPINFNEIMATVALILCLVRYVYNNKGISRAVHRSILLNNKWNAVRYGLDGTFVSPFNLEKETIRKALFDLLEQLEGIFIEFDAEDYLIIIQNMIKRGCSATVQRKVLEQESDFPQMIKKISKEFWR